jgi:uncharacterized protein
MITKYTDKIIDYDGSQLRSHWIMEEFGILGDACVSFIGGCDVKPEFMKDMEDLLNNNAIRSRRMLNFIIEIFKNDIFSSVLLQHLFVSIIQEEICKKIGKKMIERKGDDLFYEGRKLSVSIATVSPISSLIHLGLNITSEDTPVLTSNLSELSIDPVELSEAILGAFFEEYKIIKNSMFKVRTAW